MENNKREARKKNENSSSFQTMIEQIKCKLSTASSPFGLWWCFKRVIYCTQRKKTPKLYTNNQYMILESCTEMATSTNRVHKNKQYFIVEFIYLICTSYEIEQQQQQQQKFLSSPVLHTNSTLIFTCETLHCESIRIIDIWYNVHLR